MPAWLRKKIEDGEPLVYQARIGVNGKTERHKVTPNETTESILVISQLCQLDPDTEQVYFCHPAVAHISKMQREGGFCGYRNIQMMVSYIQAAQSPGYEQFPGPIPNILTLQDLIEDAWDKGINVSGRAETGGIKGTRKYIGTPEAQAMLLSLDIPCNALAFQSSPEGSAYEGLFDAVETYFQRGCAANDKKIQKTWMPPLYFQHPGHSLTIIGFERKKSGARNLLVFDPSFKAPQGVRDNIGATSIQVRNPAKLLGAYRKGAGYLRKYKQFEILM